MNFSPNYHPRFDDNHKNQPIGWAPDGSVITTPEQLPTLSELRCFITKPHHLVINGWIFVCPPGKPMLRWLRKTVEAWTASNPTPEYQDLIEAALHRFAEVMAGDHEDPPHFSR